MRFDHINITAPEDLLNEVKNFYCEVLGLSEGFRPKFSRGGYWLYSGDRALVHLSIHSAPPGTGTRGYLDHVAFQTSGLEAFVARLNSLGLEFRTSYVPELDMTQLFFKDPAGTGLEVNFPGEP